MCELYNWILQGNVGQWVRVTGLNGELKEVLTKLDSSLKISES